MSKASETTRLNSFASYHHYHQSESQGATILNTDIFQHRGNDSSSSCCYPTKRHEWWWSPLTSWFHAKTLDGNSRKRGITSSSSGYGYGEPIPPKTLSEYAQVSDYDGESHAKVLFQLYGSVWPKVLPWCLATSVFSLAIYLLDKHAIDLTIHNSVGHSFMSMLVSFLIVTRTSITYKRYLDCRQGLQQLFHASREIVQYACVFTLPNTNKEAIAWRQNVAYYTIVMLRTATAALEYKSGGVSCWMVLPEQEQERTELMMTDDDDDEYDTTTTENDNDDNDEKSIARPHARMLGQLAHSPRSHNTENFRAPVIWAFNLRQKLLEPRTNASILPTYPMALAEEIKLLQLVSDFGAAMEDLKKLVETPFSFPLEQMTRSFLFFWLFSLPLVLLRDQPSMWSVLVLMCILTYGFIGLESVNIELDDPFGSDPNDFPGHSWSELVFEDAYIAVYKTDGYASAKALRSRTNDLLEGRFHRRCHRKDSDISGCRSDSDLTRDSSSTFLGSSTSSEWASHEV